MTTRSVEAGAAEVQTFRQEGLRDRRGTELPRRYVILADGSRLAYADAGAGTPIVLIHGVLTVLDDMVAALSDRLTPDHRVVAFDRPGYGHSAPARPCEAGPFRQAELLWEALGALGLERSLLVGHSFGATVAVAMAMLRPRETRGVVALAPIVLPEWRLEHGLFGPRVWADIDWARVIGAGVDRHLLPILWRGMFLPQPIPLNLERAFPFSLAGKPEAGARIGADCIVAGPDLIRFVLKAAALPVPTRILAGDQDFVVNNLAHGAILAAMLPSGRFELLRGVGHMVHHVAPQAVVAAVRQLDEPGEIG